MRALDVVVSAGVEGGKAEYPEKNPRSTEETNYTRNSTHTRKRTSGIRHAWLFSVSTFISVFLNSKIYL